METNYSYLVFILFTIQAAFGLLFLFFNFPIFLCANYRVILLISLTI